MKKRLVPVKIIVPANMKKSFAKKIKALNVSAEQYFIDLALRDLRSR